MTADEWARLLGVNTAFLAVVFAFAAVWIWLLRRSAWAGRIRMAVLIAVVIAALYGVVVYVGAPPPPADTPAFVWPWGLVVFVGIGVALLSLLVLLISSILLGYRRIRRGTTPQPITRG